ncbi:YqjF family protein [Cytobacillus oceanisediminis]|uniref:YqjF family protein n=1 Tax=Cytobacillus oceanisediminis TaxID=665099 RepID=UPI003735A92E
MKKEIKITGHRPFPMPNSPWIMEQIWNDILFLHWPVPAEVMEKHIPPQLKLDTYNGTAWIGIVPFWISKMRVRGFPPMPFMNSMNELNVRTYVEYEGRKGVYFFSLDANNPLAVTGARMLYFLPYMDAEMNVTHSEGKVIYESRRKSGNSDRGHFFASYKASSNPYNSEPGTFDAWLTERYCLWVTKGNRVFRGDIHHTKWQLHEASCHIQHNSMASFLPREYFQGQPILHYSPQKHAFFWPLKRVT